MKRLRVLTRFNEASRLPSALLAGLLAVSCFTVKAQTNVIVFQSSAQKTSLLELYTSEGCSSCPPAEAWLSRQKDASGLWKDFVPVAFHVDYWDYLGWRDPWAARRFSDRQRAYAQGWGSDTVYTPGFVADGLEWRGWSGRQEVPRPQGEAGVLTVKSVSGNRWQVSFVPALSGKSYELNAALLVSGLTSDVKAGENRGRRLIHDFVVVDFVNQRLVKSGNTFEGKCVLVPESKTGNGRPALAVWVTLTGRQEST